MNAWAALATVPGGGPSAAETPGRVTPFRRQLVREGVLRDLAVDGYRYAVADLGEGYPVVLLHGVGGSIYDWRHLIRPLSERHRVVAPDLLGAGESDRPADGDYTLAAQARRLRGLLDALGIGRAALVGNSYGGGVALRFAQDWPERTDRLVLINSICYPDVLPRYVPWCRLPGADRAAELVPLGRLVRRALRGCGRTIGALSEEEFGAYVEEVRLPGRRAAVVNGVRSVLREDAREFQARLGSVRAPALLIWGAADRTVPVELGRRLARELPRARLVELDAGHGPHQECPGAVAREILGFLP